jgi:hypothetical protein
VGLYLFSRPVASDVAPVVGMPELVETLAANVGRFVSPVLRRGGIWGYFRPEVAVRVAPQVSEKQVESLLSPFGSITVRDWGGMDGVYRLALSTASAVEALEIANRLAVREDVLWAQVSVHNRGPGPSDRYEPNDDYFEDGLQWGVDHRDDVAMWEPQEDLDVNGPEGWFLETGSSNEPDYVYVIGTSHSSPKAAGVAATVLSRNLSLSSQAVEWVLRESALDLGSAGWDGSFGWGLPRMDAAIDLADALIFFDGFETGDAECWDSTACSGGN